MLNHTIKYLKFQFSDNEHLRHARQDDQHHHQEEYYTSHNQYTAPSEAVPIILPFPGTEPSNRGGEGASGEDKHSSYYYSAITATIPAMHGGRRSRFSMPLALIGEKKYYIGMFFKVCHIFPIITFVILQLHFVESKCRYWWLTVANYVELQTNFFFLYCKLTMLYCRFTIANFLAL